MIPKFEYFLKPFLETLNDKGLISNKEILNQLERNLELTEEEKLENYNGRDRKVYNHIRWARTYLKQAELITYPSRGFNEITDLGKKILREFPNEITLKDLKKSTPFLSNRTNKDKERKSIEVYSDIIEENTPQELIEKGFYELEEKIKEELLIDLKKVKPYFFEKVVIDLLKAMGYGGYNFKEDRDGLTPKSNDGGIDGIMRQDPLGLDKVYIQAKRWEGSVGRKDIQSFIGALSSKQSKKGVFITTSNFSSGAKEFTKMVDSNTTVILVDGEELVSLMIEYNIGVSPTEKIYQIKKIDSDYFEDEI